MTQIAIAGWPQWIILLAVLLHADLVRAGVNAWTSLGPDGGGARILVIDPQNPDTVYASTDAGLFKSIDGAGSWSAMSPLPAGTGAILSLVVDPQNSGTLYAAGGLGDPGREVVFKSTDGGASWATVNSGLPTTFVNGSQNYLVTSLVIDPAHPDTPYANGNGAFRSTDGGATWSSVSTGLSTLLVNALAIDPQDTGTVYAGTAGGLFVITFAPDGL